MKTAIYTRLSKDRTGLSENCAIQLEECRAYLQDQGWIEVLALEENDTSGSQYSTKPRPKYEKELIPAIEQGYVEVILVTEMPRLYRRMEELLELISLARTTSLQLIQTTDGIRYDLSTPEGRKAAMDAVSNAIYETAKLSRRLLRKKAVRASQGKYLGGYRAYGYEGPQYDDEGTLLNRGRINTVVIESEAAVIKTCVERLIAGERSTTIIRDMNQHGIPSPAGKQWTIGNFKRTISRKHHVIFDDDDPEQRGTLEYHGREYQARWPGIITHYQHGLMMARFEETKQPWVHGLKGGRTYLLSGMIYCACGKKMIGTRRRLRDGSMQRRYRCRKFDNHGNAIGCGKVYRGAEAVDLLVTEAALRRFEDPEVAEALIKQGESAESRRLFEKLSNLQRHRKEIVAEYGRSEHTKADYKALLLAADEAIAATQAQLAKYTQARATSVIGNLDKLRQTWPSASLEWQRSVISLVVERVVVYPMKRTGTAVWNGYRFDPTSVEVVWRDIDQAGAAANLCWLVKMLQRSQVALAAQCLWPEPVGARQPLPFGQMLRSTVGSIRHSVSAGPVLVRPGVGWSSACGVEAGLPGRVWCHVAARAVAPGVVVDGRRDRDAAPPARGRPARAAWYSFAVDVAGSGVAGAARRDGAGREPVGSKTVHRWLTCEYAGGGGRWAGRIAAL